MKGMQYANFRILPNWVAYGPSWDAGQQNTNLLWLLDPKLSSLSPYVINYRVYKCPSDNFLSSEQKQAGWKERLLSTAMNGQMGEGQGFPVIRYTKLSGFKLRSPSEAWVFIDEHPDYFNADCQFYMGLMSDPAFETWADLPSSLHSRAATISFADGHAQIKKWKDPRTIKPVTFKYGDPSSEAGNRDMYWLTQFAYEPREDIPREPF